ncbi:hypothetical protein H6G80_34820 [Nostoc sp. FACHB-87]|uniref:hypothetical protein n=1 Tax=Nostocaceae TaxID=1162 RepID=UPI00168A0BF8|nr:MULTISPECIES: hypothetical protein [Nostocaceae]MBD2459197.1 hypothetical protein [Nostoc sp. FACHB-87]MBD2480207.1 hypothetical protein [Anabaena sp. FACHB-83]
MSKWSALVYSRTYEVDFRLIAMPEIFTEQDKQWALKHILGTTRSPEKLSEQPRWSLFKNEHYCIIGVTCMARELIQNSRNAIVEDITKDSGNRPIYVFAGYVAELDGEHGLPPIPKYSDKDLEIFAPLYEYVQQRWSVKSYQQESKVPLLSQYEEIDYLAAQPRTDFDREYFALNQIDSQTVRLWPDENRENLWVATAQQVTDFHAKSVSLCLGLATQKDAVESPFLNATAFGIRQKDDISRKIESSVAREVIALPPSTPPRAESIPSDEYKDNEYSDVEEKELPFEPVEILGAVLGGLAGLRIAQIPGLLFGGSVVGFVVGAGIGWVAGGCVSNKGIGGAMAKQTRDFIGGVTSSGSQRRTRRSRSRQRDSEQQDIDYGFRTRNEENNPPDSEKPQNDDSNWF